MRQLSSCEQKCVDIIDGMLFHVLHCLQVYMRMFPSRRIQSWTIGSEPGDTAGWHCSWCFTPDKILVKLVSAQNGDFPRWGDFPEKRNLSYIRRLVATGTWFDDVTTMQRNDVITGPESLLKNKHRYRHLIENVYQQQVLATQLNAT